MVRDFVVRRDANSFSQELRGVLGSAGDRDFYAIHSGSGSVYLTQLHYDYDLFMHIYEADGTFIETRSNVQTGTTHEVASCPGSDLENCPHNEHRIYIIEVRPHNPEVDHGPIPYKLRFNFSVHMPEY